MGFFCSFALTPQYFWSHSWHSRIYECNMISFKTADKIQNPFYTFEPNNFGRRVCLLGEFQWLLPILIQLHYNYHICKTKSTNQKSIKRNGWWHLHLQGTFNVSLIFFLLSITNVFWNLSVVSIMCSFEEFHLHLICLQWLNRILILKAYNNFLWNNTMT